EGQDDVERELVLRDDFGDVNPRRLLRRPAEQIGERVTVLESRCDATHNGRLGRFDGASRDAPHDNPYEFNLALVSGPRRWILLVEALKLSIELRMRGT